MVCPTNKRIASYIRLGLQSGTYESKGFWLTYAEKHGIFRACALGLAIVGKLGETKGLKAFHRKLDIFKDKPLDAISAVLEIEPRLADKLDELHQKGMSAERIAELLETSDGADECDAFPDKKKGRKKKSE